MFIYKLLYVNSTEFYGYLPTGCIFNSQSRPVKPGISVLYDQWTSQGFHYHFKQLYQLKNLILVWSEVFQSVDEKVRNLYTVQWIM